MQTTTAATHAATPDKLVLIQPSELLVGPLRQRLFLAPLAQLLSQLLGIQGINELYAAEAHQPPGLPFYRGLLHRLNVDVRVDAQSLRRIPVSGPLIAVANHPLGVLEGVVLLYLLAQVRVDSRAMANYLMLRVPQLRETIIPVDPFGGPESTKANLASMRDALRWLRAGGALGVFPAGEVSHWNPRERRVEDPPWNPNIAALARRTGATVLPIFFHGSNGLAFHLGGMLHPRLRTAQLAREMLGKRDNRLEVCIGSPIAAESLKNWGSDSECIEMLRRCTYLLGEGVRGSQSATRTGLWRPSTVGPLLSRPLAKSAAMDLVSGEVSSLDASACLANVGALWVFEAGARECPNLVREIGRLRELSFRAVGEGSGKPRDLDRFDQSYRHLFVWNQESREVVGAYRAARVHEVLASRGPQGLYLPTLFKFQPGFFEALGPALELGRSFIRPEYQRSPAALLLLWKGIAAYVARHPECTRLLGPVSISNAYSQCSRQILVDYLRERAGHPTLSGLVQPRKPFRALPLLGWHADLTRTLAQELDDVSSLIAGIERDGKGVPVLLRQYLKLGGRLLGFNVDPHFSNVLDGLIFVDLLETNVKALDRYMGKEEAARFLAGHGRNAGQAGMLSPVQMPPS
jgi:putative hemolysin